MAKIRTQDGHKLTQMSTNERRWAQKNADRDVSTNSHDLTQMGKNGTQLNKSEHR